VDCHATSGTTKILRYMGIWAYRSTRINENIKYNFPGVLWCLAVSQGFQTNPITSHMRHKICYEYRA